MPRRPKDRSHWGEKALAAMRKPAMPSEMRKRAKMWLQLEWSVAFEKEAVDSLADEFESIAEQARREGYEQAIAEINRITWKGRRADDPR